MSTIDYKALAERLSRLADEFAAFGHHTSEQRVDDLRAVASLLDGMADDEPVLWMQSDHVGIARRSPFMARCAPSRLHPDFVPLFTHPAPQPQPERQPVSEPTEAQIEARDALLDFISENGTASEGVQHYLDRYVCAALAAKENNDADH